MIHEGYTIKRGEVVTLPSGRRRGVLDVIDPSGEDANIFTYTIRNHLSLQHARAEAKKWIDAQIKKDGKRE